MFNCLCLFYLPQADVSADIETKEVAMLKGKQRMRDQCFRRGMRVKEREREASSCLGWMRAEAGIEPDYRRNTRTRVHCSMLPSCRSPQTPHDSPFFHTHMRYGVCVTHAAPLHMKSCAVQHERLPEMRPCFEKELIVWLLRSLQVLML